MSFQSKHHIACAFARSQQTLCQVRQLRKLKHKWPPARLVSVQVCGFRFRSPRTVRHQRHQARQDFLWSHFDVQENHPLIDETARYHAWEAFGLLSSCRTRLLGSAKEATCHAEATCCHDFRQKRRRTFLWTLTIHKAFHSRTLRDLGRFGATALGFTWFIQ